VRHTAGRRDVGVQEHKFGERIEDSAGRSCCCEMINFNCYHDDVVEKFDEDMSLDLYNTAATTTQSKSRFNVHAYQVRGHSTHLPLMSVDINPIEHLANDLPQTAIRLTHLPSPSNLSHEATPPPLHRQSLNSLPPGSLCMIEPAY
jgi:hypothetical protein